MDELQKLVARVNASAFLSFCDEPAPLRRKKHRLTKRAEQLPEAHRQALLLLLSGEAALISLEGYQYAVWRTGDNACCVLGLYEGAEGVHTVVEGKCSCPHAKFRAADCRHQQAVRRAKLWE